MLLYCNSSKSGCWDIVDKNGTNQFNRMLTFPAKIVEVASILKYSKAIESKKMKGSDSNVTYKHEF